MVNKSLLYVIIGFLAGGLLVSTAFAISNQNNTIYHTGMTMYEHNEQTMGNLDDVYGDSFDKKFIEEMIMHHEGAIDMAKLITTNAKHEEIKQLGVDIIATQSKEIEEMKDWYKNWGYGTYTESEYMHMMQ